MDTDAIQKLVDSLGVAVNSIWQMKPVIVQQHVYSSAAVLIVGLIFLVIAFFVAHKYCNCDADLTNASMIAFFFLCSYHCDRSYFDSVWHVFFYQLDDSPRRMLYQIYHESLLDKKNGPLTRGGFSFT